MKKPSLHFRSRTKNSSETVKNKGKASFFSLGEKFKSGRSVYSRGQSLLSDKSVNKRSFVKQSDMRTLRMPKPGVGYGNGGPARKPGVKAFFSGFIGNFAVANKKRFSVVVSVVAVAIAVPIVIVSANSGANNYLQPAAEPQQAQAVGQPADVQANSGDNGTGENMHVYDTGQQTPEGGMEPQGTDNAAAGGGNDASQDGGSSESGGDVQAQQDGDGEQPQAQEDGSSETNAVEAGQAAADVEQQAEPEEQYMDLEPEGHSDDVIKLQQRLMELHYMDNDEPTDYYGQNTQEAVRYFQRKHELTIDAYAGAETQELLFSDEAMPYSVTEGASGLDVENIQNRLEELGYPTAGTGYFGDKTKSAVEYFQRMNGLDDDGSVGQYTKEVLFSNEAEPSLEEMEIIEREKEAEESGDSESSDGGGGGSSDDDDDDDDDGDSGGGDGGGYSSDPGSVESFIDVALAQLGKPYVRGGKGSGSYDCSGLVYYALNQSGNSIGYMTSSGWRSAGYTTIGSVGELQRGDVICFTGHVGIYLGNGEMVDASSSNGCVVRRSLGSWAHSNFICGKRPI